MICAMSIDAIRSLETLITFTLEAPLHVIHMNFRNTLSNVRRYVATNHPVREQNALHHGARLS